MSISAEDIRAFLIKMMEHWDAQGLDAERSGFFERLDQSGQPLDLPYRRTLVQCRQAFSHAHIWQLTGDSRALEGALHAFDCLQKRCRDREHGGFVFSVGLDGSVHDGTKDAYAHAFVIFACAAIMGVSEDQRELAHATASEVWAIFDTRFRDQEGRGFHEAFERDWTPIPRIRRQNPHMHLLEALLAMSDASGDPVWMSRAGEILDLFVESFFDAQSTTLGEFFTDQWKPDPEQGQIVEPGHHFEWTWLLGWWLRLKSDARFTGASSLAQEERPTIAQAGAHCDTKPESIAWIAQKLLIWGISHGWDTEFGGVFDQLDRAGGVLKDSKRVWPLTECLKALVWWCGQEPDGPARAAFDEALELFFSHYLDAGTGAWNEHLNRDLSPMLQELPGTTSYHITLGLSEALRLLGSD